MTDTNVAQPKQPPAVQADQIRNWINVVDDDHARQNARDGIVTMEQGKLGPLIRLTPGDWLIFYASRAAVGGDGKAVKVFSAIGHVVDADPYQVETETGKSVFCRDIDWLDTHEIALSDLSDKLDFTRGSWGMLARRGLFEITESDRRIILAAMKKE